MSGTKNGFSVMLNKLCVCVGGVDTFTDSAAFDLES